MTAERKGFDVVVVGGGAIGLAVARQLSREGARVAVIERDRPGQAATWAAAGMLTQLAEGSAASAFRQLCSASLALYPEFADALLAETGLDVGYRRMETVVAALDDEEADELVARRDTLVARGARVEWRSATSVRDLEPELSPEVRGGLVFLEEGQVENRALGRALWSATLESGAVVMDQSQAVRVVCRSGAVRGVDVGDRVVAADRVVVAAGAWSAGLAGLPRPLPVRPVRGQMLALETTPMRLGRLMSARHVYVVPRPDGRSLVGATVEEAGYEARTSAGGLLSLLAGAVTLIPGLGRAPVVDTWAGLRPGTPDDMPILGADPEVDGLVYATGHYMNGILLTPVTARVVSDVLARRPPTVDITPYAPRRFDDEREEGIAQRKPTKANEERGAAV